MPVFAARVPGSQPPNVIGETHTYTHTHSHSLSHTHIQDTSPLKGKNMLRLIHVHIDKQTSCILPPTGRPPVTHTHTHTSLGLTVNKCQLNPSNYLPLDQLCPGARHCNETINTTADKSNRKRGETTELKNNALCCCCVFIMTTGSNR